MDTLVLVFAIGFIIGAGAFIGGFLVGRVGNDRPPRVWAKNHWHTDLYGRNLQQVNDCPAFTAGDSAVCTQRAPYSA